MRKPSSPCHEQCCAMEDSEDPEEEGKQITHKTSVAQSFKQGDSPVAVEVQNV